ncbi:MAG: hypothetical protein GXO72_06110 [Caldiserica bacterium]|nr:hypothetical protein [Caldisericota bacterium]
MRRLLPALAALFLLGVAWGQGVPGGRTEEQWYERLRDTGLPREVVAVLPVEIPGAGIGAPQRVLFVFVYIDERALESRTRWRDVLAEFVDKDAVLIWAYSQIPLVQVVRFDPLALWFSQGEWEFRPEAEDFTDVDGDFLAGEVYFGKPVAAIVLLGEGFTPTEPLVVHYGDLGTAVIPLVSGDRGP